MVVCDRSPFHRMSVKRVSSTPSFWQPGKPMTDRFLVFVYGTLKKGFPNHDRYMQQARRMGTFRTWERYRLVLNGDRYSPCMIAGAGRGRRVVGELYEVDPAGLAMMDRLERIDCPDGYRRHRIRVDRVDGPPSDAYDVFVYLKAPEGVDDPRSEALETYTLEEARMYRNRTVNRSIGENKDEIGST